MPLSSKQEKIIKQLAQSHNQIQNQACFIIQCQCEQFALVHDFSCVSSSYTGGVNSKRSASGKKQNSCGNLKILPGIRSLGKFFGETQSKEVNISRILRFSGEFLPNIRDDIPNFREDCHLHTVMLKQRLLEGPRAVTPRQLWCTQEVWRPLEKDELPSAIASSNSYAAFALSTSRQP